MTGVTTTYENYYFCDDALLFDPRHSTTVRYGAYVKMRDSSELEHFDEVYTLPARWRGLPIAPLTWHPSEPATVPRLTEKRRKAAAEVLASALEPLDRETFHLDRAAT
jgi:hypothetical protein